MESSTYSIRIRPLYEESNPIVWTTFSYVSTLDRKTQETPVEPLEFPEFLEAFSSNPLKPFSKAEIRMLRRGFFSGNEDS